MIAETQESPSVRLGSVAEVARRLSVSTRWVWKALAAGQMIQPIRLGRSVRFDLNELNRWVDAGCPGVDKWNAVRTADSATAARGAGRRSAR